MKPAPLHTLLTNLTALASLAFTLILVRESLSPASLPEGWDPLAPAVRGSTPPKAYSWEGEDFPPLLPIPPSPRWLMQIEESVHYDFLNPESNKEWLVDRPLSIAGINLGPRNRAFAVSMFHQLHCIRGFRTTLAYPQVDMKPSHHEHLEHCVSMLRQLSLCKADLTLEPGDFMKRDLSKVRTGAMHVCNRDLEPVYDMLESNWLEWNHLMKYTNVNIPLN